jgi:hypothetical protein
MISSTWLDGRDRYERVVDGWSDATHDDAFTHTVRATDDDFGVEVRAVCTPPPDYEVREASARITEGAADPGVEESLRGLRGARMVGGFTKRLVAAAGDGAGAPLFVEAGLEIARLARQVTKLPLETTAGLRPDDARRFWELDNMGWADLPHSCFTYTPAGEALFASRAVKTNLPPEIFNTPTGAMQIFRRKRLVRLVRTGRRLHLFHSMYDNGHGFDIHCEIDLDAETIVAADSIVSRLPYEGLCDVTQGKMTSLKGEVVNGSLRKRVQTLLGGETGCTQLYVLTTDLLKMLTIS